jgi:2-polyprenyl-3-methyl-5-hydroxy-6-metoxy-1,4-benzoquinol methylase
MLQRIEHREEAISGSVRAEEYVETSKKHFGKLYRRFSYDIKQLNVPGHYLEIGAGAGILASIVAGQMPRVKITAIDLSTDMAHIANGYISEKGLLNRINYTVCDIGNGSAMQELGQFDLVYSFFSLHHWKRPQCALDHAWKAVKAGGTLYIWDLKRVWWLYALPVGGGFIESIRASFLSKEMEGMLKNLGIKNYSMKTLFPYFLHCIVAKKL